MEEIFVSKIDIKDARVVKELVIPISDKERKHLIITGKNGSGKTSLLLEINKYLKQVLNGNLRKRILQTDALKYFNNNILKLKSLEENHITNAEIERFKDCIRNIKNWFDNFGQTEISFTNEHLLWEKIETGSFIIAFFEAKRHIDLTIPSGINKITLQKKYTLENNANENFIQYLVNLKAERSFAKDDGEENIVAEIDKWFDNFQERLRDLFDSPSLELKFDRKTYNFEIVEKDKEPYGFNTLSDGYSAIVTIITELLLRMEAHKVKNYDMEGLVLIDEIETHLHVELQKKILPFIINFFPKIQFIVTTHSPFILSSISNSVICNLEHKEVVSDLSGYSYDALIESYFDSDKYSNIVKSKIEEYELLLSKDKLDQEEKLKLKELEKYFSSIPKYLSEELSVKLQSLSLKSLTKKRK